MASNALAVVREREMTPMEAHAAYLDEKREIIVAQCIPADYRDQPAVIDAFFELARLRGLNPILKQINCIKRGGKPSIETSLAGYRLIAARTGIYAGNDEYVHLGVEDGHPVVSSCTVWKFVNGERCPFTASVRWDEFAAYREGKPSNNWASMPFHMLGKTAETHALRKAFPEETSGLYTSEEMEQSENVPTGPPRQVRAPGAAVTAPARIAPLSAPRTRPPQQPNGQDQMRERVLAKMREKGMRLDDSVAHASYADLAACVDIEFRARGKESPLRREADGSATPGAIMNALLALPSRVVDRATGEVIEGESREAGPADDYADIAAATDQGVLLPKTATE